MDSGEQYRPTMRATLLNPNIVDNPKPVQIINVNRAAILCFLICLSPAYYGYSLTIIGACNLSVLFQSYNITIAKETALALMNGMLPIGGMIGCLLFPKLRMLTTKKKLHYYLAICSSILCAVSVIPSFSVLVIIRFFLGILSAQYMALSINLIKEHFSDDYWKPFGAVYSAMRILGILLAYIIGQMFSGTTTRDGNITLFFGPAFIAIIQAITLGYNLPDSPVQLLRENQTGKAAEALQQLYSHQDSEKRLNELRLKIKRSVPSKFDTISNPMNMCAMHLALLRQFCGVTYLVVYASQIPIHTQTALGSAGFVVENSIQMIGGMIGIPMVMNLSRYKMVAVSTVLLLFLNLSIGMGSLFEISQLAFASICVFMFICGSTLTSVTWTYPAELATPGLEKWGSVVSMGGTAIVTIVPPFVTGAMPNGEAYPIFFFFALYLGIAAILNDYLLPRDKPSNQTVQIELALGT